MRRLRDVGAVFGFEKVVDETGESMIERIQVNRYDVEGIIYVNSSDFVEEPEDMYSGMTVFEVGRGMYSVSPSCGNCKQDRFLLDDDTLHCPFCE